jgi:preprotein translocase subunit SecF
MQFNFTKYSIFYYIISGLLIIASIVFISMYGLKFGIEFVGGSNMQVDFQKARPSNEAIKNALKSFNLGEITIQPTGATGAVIQFKGIDEATHQNILTELNKLAPSSEKSFQYIGPSIGQELRNKTELAIFLALVAITLYIAFAFRKVSRPVSSWKY